MPAFFFDSLIVYIEEKSTTTRCQRRDTHKIIKSHYQPERQWLAVSTEKYDWKSKAAAKKNRSYWDSSAEAKNSLENMNKNTYGSHKMEMKFLEMGIYKEEYK